MKKQNKGITLVALVITIIILLILAGITLSLTLGQQGTLKQAERAGKEYANAERNETKTLDELYSSIRVADDSMVTISMKELDEYIDEKIANSPKRDFTEVELWNGNMSSTGEIELTDDYTNYRSLIFTYGDRTGTGNYRTTWEVLKTSIQEAKGNNNVCGIYWFADRFIGFSFLDDTKKINIVGISNTELFKIVGLK